MAQFSIAERNFPAGLMRQSPSINLPEQATHIQTTLISSEWTAKAGQGSVYWGIEYSTNGTDWSLLVGSTSQFGYMPKGIYMPSIGFTTGGPDMDGQIRLFAQASATIRLGINVETSVIS